MDFSKVAFEDRVFFRFGGRSVDGFALGFYRVGHHKGRNKKKVTSETGDEWRDRMWRRDDNLLFHDDMNWPLLRPFFCCAALLSRHSLLTDDTQNIHSKRFVVRF